MSVNSTLHRDFVPELEALTQMVKTSIDAWYRAPTMEARLELESNLIDQFHSVLTATEKIEELSTNDYLEVWDLSPERRLVNDKVKMNTAKLNAIVQMYLEYFNKSKTDILDLIGSTKRCRQKLATLRLWDRSQDKWLISEPFLNFNNLNLNFTNTTMANVVTSSGFLTLPISKEEEVTVAKIKILSSSNGIPGNSEGDEVVTENRLPVFMIDKKKDNWFEYERLDSGPCQLEVQMFFPKADIVNGIEVEAINLGDSINWKIQDISFTLEGGETVEINKLVSPSLPQDYFIVKTVGSESYWEIAHMPVKASSVTMKFVQAHSYQINTSIDNNRIVKRERFAIGVKNISFKKNKYNSEGGINSSDEEIPSGMYSAGCTGHVYPRNKNLFNFNMNLSINGGETWQNDLIDLPHGEGETVLIDGNPFACVWSLKLGRNDSAFKEASSFSDEEPRLEMKSFQGTVSKAQSPATFKVKGKPYNKEVFVLQPGLVKKSSSIQDAIPFGRRSFLGGDLTRKLFFPFSLSEKGIDPKDLRIFVNDEEWFRTKSNNSSIPIVDGGLGWGCYYLSPDKTYVEFAPANEAPTMGDFQKSPLLAVEFMLREEKMSFIERSDGYYCKFQQLFDPDKENIKIARLPSIFSNTTIALKKDSKEIDLCGLSGSKISYIKDIKFLSNFSPIEVAEYKDLPDETAPTHVYIDKVNGVLYFNKELTVNASINVEHFTPITLSDEEYEIWMDGPRPVGVVVSPDSMSTLDITDVLADPDYVLGTENWIAPVKRLDVETGEWSYKAGGMISSDPYSNNEKIFTLTEDKIMPGSVILSSEVFGYENYPAPKEQEYIDGNIEFLGLTPMEKEFAPSIEADVDGFVEFRLAASRAWYAPFDILWKQGAGTGSLIFNQDEPRFSNGATLRNEIAAGGHLQPTIDGEIPGANKAAWSVDSDGVVTVFIGVGKELPGNVSANYFYTDPTFDRKNRFSVDYDKGTLYLSEKLDPSKRRSVFYKTASYSLSYTVANEINTYEYKPKSNVVEVRTENIANVNNKVKITWGKAPQEINLEELKDYFSPIVYQVGVRFQ